MDRISRQLAFMQTAQVWSQRSTCFRRNVGAVIVVNNSIVAIGYNGPLAGEPHCTGQYCVPPGKVGCQRAIHAEVNVLERVPESLRTSIKQLYVTESPCIACASIIENDKTISDIYYLNEYRVRAGLDMLVHAKRGVWRMTPAGYVVSYRTGELQI